MLSRKSNRLDETMKALTFIAIAAMSMWISGTAIAQQPNQTEGNPSLPQVEGNEAAGQRGQGKGRRGGRRGMQQGQQGQQGQGQGKGQGRRGKGQQGQGQGRRGGAQMMEFLFKRFDKNQDGKISQSEAPDRMKERFGNLDTNSDKSVSKEELQAAFEKMSGQGGGRGKGKGEGQNGAGKGKGKNGAGKGQGKNGAGKGEGKKGAGKGQRQGQRGGMMDPEKMLQFMDKNKDGVIALDEAPEKMKSRFDRLDADGSGTITSEELTSAFEKMQKGGKGGKDGKQIGRNKSANPEATKPVKPKRPPMADGGA